MDAVETSPLSERIAKALAEASTFPAAGIASLIAETTSELQRLAEAHETARKLSLDPRSHADAIANAHAAASEMTFRMERLEVALDHLQRAHKLAQKREADLAAKARLAQATAERDALAQELRETYPILAGEIADLFARIKAFDQTRPPGIDPVESAARGLRPNAIHWLLTSVHLPAFDLDAHARGLSLWPLPIVHAVPLPPTMIERSAAHAAYARQAAEMAAVSKQHEARSATRRLP